MFRTGSTFLLVFWLPLLSGCFGGGLAQPFDKMKGQPITMYHLQNADPTPAQTSTATPFPIPPQIEQWITAGAQLLPPGLLPPGLVPGVAPVAQQEPPKFHGYRILGWRPIQDEKAKDELLNVLGHESSFRSEPASCMYAELGFAIAQPNAPPADILVSLTCNQVQAHGIVWPYGKTALTPDASRRILELARRAFFGSS